MSDKLKSKKINKLEELEKKCKEYLNGWQRAQADYQNLKKEILKEKEGFAKFAKSNYVLELLPLYSNFETAFKHLPDDLSDNEWVQGILHIKDQFSNLLKNLNVEKIKTKDQKFDSILHEAVAQENSNNLESGTIIREVAPGFKLDGDVFVPAKVVVAE